jgi:hypothetical protein
MTVSIDGPTMPAASIKFVAGVKAKYGATAVAVPGDL